MKKRNSIRFFVYCIILTALCLSFMSFAPEVAAKQKFIIIGTGNTGGLYYPMGGVFASLVNKKIKGVRASAEVTGASFDNCNFVGLKKMDIGLANSDTIIRANKGEKPYFTQKYELMALFNTFRAEDQVYVLKNSHVKSIYDLKGERVSVGSPGSSTMWKAKIILKAYGLSFDDIKPAYLTFGEAVNALIDGNIEAAHMLIPVPCSATIDLTTRAKVRAIGHSKEKLQWIQDRHPYLTPGKISAGVLRGIDEDVPVPGIGNICFVHRDFNPELAYKFTKLIIENLEYIWEVLPVLKKHMSNKTVAKIPESIPIHPGSLKYLKERGML